MAKKIEKGHGYITLTSRCCYTACVPHSTKKRVLCTIALWLPIHYVFPLYLSDNTLTKSTRPSNLPLRNCQHTVQFKSHVLAQPTARVIVFCFKLELVLQFMDQSLGSFTIQFSKPYKQMCSSTFVLQLLNLQILFFRTSASTN